MGLTVGGGPFSASPNGTFNFERQGPEHVLYFEDWPRRVRGIVAGETVVDTRRAKLLYETGIPPMLYVPHEDVWEKALEPSELHTHCPFKGEASYWTIRVGDTVLPDAVWGYPEPIAGAPPLAGYVSFYAHRFDRWLEEDEEVPPYPRDPYHRVDVRATTQPVEVRLRGELIGRAENLKLLFETGLPVSHYLPAGQVRTERLTASETVTRCPYKGVLRYWHVRLGDEVVEDAAWAISEPTCESAPAVAHICFDPEKVEVQVG
jgi:uncharacterized protein (DUF427 family)